MSDIDNMLDELKVLFSQVREIKDEMEKIRIRHASLEGDLKKTYYSKRTHYI